MASSEFLGRVEEAAQALKGIPKENPVKLVGHIDADGIAATAIMMKVLQRLGYQFSVSNVQQLSETVLEDLAGQPYNHIIFVDLGSSLIAEMGKLLGGRKIIILDHHSPKKGEGGDLVHVNPHLFGIDGGSDISGAGVCYLVARAVGGENKDLSYLGIVGALGDSQYSNGFRELNSIVLGDAKDAGKMAVEKGLNIFGFHSRPLYKALCHSGDLYIPDVSGSESGAIQFLTDIGIHPKAGASWRTLSSLSTEEEQRLVEAVILRREGEEMPEDVFSDRFVLVDEKKESYFYDAKEFSTLLNACGRLGRIGLGLRLCLGSEDAKGKAQKVLQDYKYELTSALDWLRGTEEVTKGDGWMLANAKSVVKSTIIGTVASMVTKGKIFPVDYVILMARDNEGNCKISMRSSKDGIGDVRAMLGQIVGIVGGESGGHAQAAGALIDVEREDDFIAEVKNVLDKKVVKKN